LEFNMLVDCTIKFLQAIIILYESEKVTNEVLNDNTRVKIHFLCSNIRNMKNKKDKKEARLLINKCHSILCHTANVF
jgi:hypothetical protein